MNGVKFDAKRLFEKFVNHVPAKISYLEFGGNDDDLKNITIEAKKCAVIAVNEIIDQAALLEFTVLHTEFGEKLNEINAEIKSKYAEFVMYWNLVKNEIEYL